MGRELRFVVPPQRVFFFVLFFYVELNLVTLWIVHCFVPDRHAFDGKMNNIV